MEIEASADPGRRGGEVEIHNTRHGQNRNTLPRGEATIYGHHGEILQGAFRGPAGIQRGLLTLPCTAVRATAAFVATDSDVVQVEPAWKTKAALAVSLLLTSAGKSVRGGTLTINGDTPPSRGLGSSTIDVVSALVAVARAIGVNPTPLEAAKLSIAAEGASDPLMFPFPGILFAQRNGTILEAFARSAIDFTVLGFSSDLDARGIDTLGISCPKYTDKELETYEQLRRQTRLAFATNDTVLLAQVATRSAVLNQRIVCKPILPDLIQIGISVGALGLQIAHSGDVAGFLFRTGDPRIAEICGRANQRLAAVGINDTWLFRSTYGRCQVDWTSMSRAPLERVT